MITPNSSCGSLLLVIRTGFRGIFSRNMQSFAHFSIDIWRLLKGKPSQLSTVLNHFDTPPFLLLLISVEPSRAEPSLPLSQSPILWFISSSWCGWYVLWVCKLAVPKLCNVVSIANAPWFACDVLLCSPWFSIVYRPSFILPAPPGPCLLALILIVPLR